MLQAVVALPVIIFVFLVEPVSLRMTDNQAPLLGNAKGDQLRFAPLSARLPFYTSAIMQRPRFLPE